MQFWQRCTRNPPALWPEGTPRAGRSVGQGPGANPLPTLAAKLGTPQPRFSFTRYANCSRLRPRLASSAFESLERLL